eukprot:TRINITY_DN8879_c0_g2_i1.p1 TRINITY_DN8879_c0_g2~~TRINITY_DN8879_c0_g2_i1.p1  ORF type:complete len:646 (+),score=120.10 TRINITY_DN8879_c0_g2_i1:84-1940(+)
MDRRLSLPGMASHLQSTIAVVGEGDSRPHRSAEFVVVEERKTTFIQGRRIGMISAVLNLVNAIIGSGVLGLPYIMAGSGTVLFLVMLGFTALIMDYSLQLLIASAAITHQPGQPFSYELLGEQAFGLRGRVLVSLMVMVQNCANMTSYFKVFKDVISSLIGSDYGILGNSDFTTSVAAIAFVFPIACSSRVGFLGYVGVLQMIIVGTFVGYVAYQAFHFGSDIRDGSEDGGSIELFAPSSRTFLAMPTMCFSYICHTALLPIYDELQEADDLGRTKRPRKRISLVVHFSIAIATSLYAVASVAGYQLFGKNTDKDLLDSFSNDEFYPSNHAVKLLFAVCCLLSVPLQCVPFRRAFTSMKNIAMGEYEAMTWLAKSTYGLEKFNTLSARDRAEALNIQLDDIPETDTETLNFALSVLDDPNLYKYTVPSDVNGAVIIKAFGPYVRWIRNGCMMLVSVPIETPEDDNPDKIDIDSMPTCACPAPKEGWLSHVAKTALAVGICLSFALFVPAITVVFAAAGATSSVWLEIILPAAIYLKLSLSRANLSNIKKFGSVRDTAKQDGSINEEDSDDEELLTQALKEEVSPFASILPSLLLGFGCFVFPVSWGGMLYNWGVFDSF